MQADQSFVHPANQLNKRKIVKHEMLFFTLPRSKMPHQDSMIAEGAHKKKEERG